MKRVGRVEIPQEAFWPFSRSGLKDDGATAGSQVDGS